MAEMGVEDKSSWNSTAPIDIVDVVQAADSNTLSTYLADSAISSEVVNRPKLKRIDDPACSTVKPKAPKNV